MVLQEPDFILTYPTLSFTDCLQLFSQLTIHFCCWLYILKLLSVYHSILQARKLSWWDLFCNESMSQLWCRQAANVHRHLYSLYKKEIRYRNVQSSMRKWCFFRWTSIQSLSKRDQIQKCPWVFMWRNFTFLIIILYIALFYLTKTENRLPFCNNLHIFAFGNKTSFIFSVVLYI